MIFNFYESQGILIDAGPPSYYKNVMNLLNQSGIKLIIITHGHYDHYGSLSRALKEVKWKGKVLAHEQDIDFIKKGQNAPVKKVSQLPKLTAKFYMKGLTPLKNISAVKKDMSLYDDYGIEAEIIHTPGHTDGSISVVFKDKAYIGDLLRGSFIRSNKPSYPWAYQDLEKIKASIQKLSSFLDEDAVLYPGHGKPFKMKDATALL
ncbi:MAG: MBL fold metallo-hydrolase [Candidatus Nanohaloarchaeota archaeon]|nr:MBL fold metallo-hydrolase [Candidatus Nanohaloarchaeota archaeon]